MDEKLILTKVAQFMSSEKWWQPIVSFMYHNCSNFTENNYTFENFDSFQNFKRMIEKLIDQTLCEIIKIDADQLENVINSATKKFDLSGLVIIDLLRKATDFREFHYQMVAMNKKIESDVASLIAKYSDQLSQPGVDKEKIAVYFSKVLAQSESEHLNEIIQKNCETTRKILKLNPRKQINRANTYVPKNQKSVHLKPKFFTTNEEIPEIPQELISNEPQNQPSQPISEPQINNTVSTNIFIENAHEETNKMKEEIERRKAFYREQREKMRQMGESKTYEKSKLPPLIRHNTFRSPRYNHFRKL